ncbi:hypothetical protein BV911_00670 [Pseudoruegeria sp. SK021]|nr:hypothetical protein BV911_00670 [Pseudoruegeria sp. SK021]
MPLRISNRAARALWLSQQGLASPPTGPLDLPRLIDQLGFVQLDSIQVVARAQHHILWSRNQSYREPMLDACLARDRAIFEHFTHDASVLPMSFLPLWRRQFDRKAQHMARAGWIKDLPDAAARAVIKARIAAEGPLSTHAFDTKVSGPRKMWSRPPHKLALDYMWYSGELATCHRVNFNKYYDLAERVFPAHLRDQCLPEQDQIDGLCHAALTRLGMGTLGEIQKFWDAVTPAEVRAWANRHGPSLRPVLIESAQGDWTPALAPVDIETRLAALTAPSTRTRILNPFDPAIRDRSRLSRLFGFDYRVEMFVPAAKRLWGYYVFPILEGHRFTGRIEVKADRARSVLTVLNLWPEPGMAWPAARHDRLRAELDRMARFIGVAQVVWDTPETGPTKVR